MQCGISPGTMESERDVTLTFFPVMSWPLDVLILVYFPYES